MLKKVTVYFTLFVATCFFTHCATIIHGSRQTVVIVCDPKKAAVDIDGINVGYTPYLARLTRKNKHLVKIEMDGYIPYEITLKRKLDGWIFGNIMIGGIIGIAVDAATGSMFSLSPKDVSATLKSTNKVFNPTKDEIYLTVVLRPDANWQKIGQLQKLNTDNNYKKPTF
ncbi:PEGA domain-containing protein [Ferruginibacter sp.]|uniref:PEGA domain-containing protein n=1 Tax=Ferruginibacter sp. TaxID=1940288 RepID=UPI0019C0303A|nr:PEGA domain-containing protein [Ferruginibacter sp.]MBC7627734.1 PEGA domain-containing protein [Ferruginibacter sp.]